MGICVSVCVRSGGERLVCTHSDGCIRMTTKLNARPTRPQDHNERDEDNTAQSDTVEEMLALSPEMT